MRTSYFGAAIALAAVVGLGGCQPTSRPSSDADTMVSNAEVITGEGRQLVRLKLPGMT